MRCGSKVGLWHFDFGPPKAVDAGSSLRGMEKNPQGWVPRAAGQREIPAYLAHGYRHLWGDLPRCEWVRLLLSMYLGTSGQSGQSGYRVLLPVPRNGA